MLHSICIISISVVYGRVQSVLCECSVNKTTPSTKDTTKATRHQQTADVVHLIKPAGHTGTGETHQLTTLSAPPPGSLHQTGKQMRPCKTSRLRDGGVSHMTNPPTQIPPELHYTQKCNEFAEFYTDKIEAIRCAINISTSN